jgi:mono/diheme cytochrome c family protein
MSRKRFLKVALSSVISCGSLLLLARLSYSDDGGDPGAADDWNAPADAAKKVNPVKADRGAVDAGKQIFTTICITCHGPAGKGDGPAAIALNPPPKDLTDPKITTQTDGELFWKISTGKNAMPAYGQPKQLTETERWEVIDYLRALCPPPATQPAGN